MHSTVDGRKLPVTWVQYFGISEKIMASMPYQHFRVNIYKNSSARDTRYFYTPLALLDQETIISQYNSINRRAEVSFRIELWNKNVETHVISYLKKIVGTCIENHQVQIIPFDCVLLSSIEEPQGYRLNQNWTLFQLNKSIEFTLICCSLEESQALAAEMRNQPSHFSNVDF